MALYEIQRNNLNAIPTTTYEAQAILERQDLQKHLRAQIDIIAKDTYVITDEYSGWKEEESRIDILAVDKKARLVVVELKRTQRGEYSDLQAIRYAAMISPMTFTQAVTHHQNFLQRQEEGSDGSDAEERILDFLGWDEPKPEDFAQKVRIILASADFTKDLTTAVIWLTTQHNLDISCVRMKPYLLDGNRVIVDVQQVLPLPEAADFLVQMKEKDETIRQHRDKFEVSIDDITSSGLTKRESIHFLCTHLCEKGVSPENIAVAIGKNMDALWRFVEGIVGHDDFIGMALAKYSEIGRAFDEGRYFCSDDELIHFNESTYALWGNWGDPEWAQSMDQLVSEFQDFELRYGMIE